MLKFYQEIDRAKGKSFGITKKVSDTAGLLLLGYGIYKAAEYFWSDDQTETSNPDNEFKSKKGFR